MSKRQILFLCVGVCFFACALWYGRGRTTDQYLTRYTNKVEHWLHQQERTVEDKLKDISTLLTLAYNYLPSARNDEILQELDKEAFTLCLYVNDSLVFWSNNYVLPYQSEVINAEEGFQAKYIELSNGSYEWISHQFRDADSNKVTAIGLIPVHHRYALESYYFQNDFVADPFIPKNILATEEVNAYPVKRKSGEILCYLQAEGDISDARQQTTEAILLAIAFILIGFFIHDFSKTLVKRGKQWWGASFFLLAAIGLRMVGHSLNLRHELNELALFSQEISSKALSFSLGDLLLNIVFLVWIMVFFNREFKTFSYAHLSPGMRFSLSVLYYLGVFIGVVALTEVFQHLVMDSSLNFDFDNVFNLSIYSFLSLGGVVLMLLALFLFSYWIIHSVLRLETTKFQRMASLSVAAVLGCLYAYTRDLDLPEVRLILAGMIYMILFDLFIDNKTPNLTWLIIWLLIFSIFSSLIMFKYNSDKDTRTRIDYAYALAEDRDTIAERGITAFIQKIEADNFISQYLSSPFQFNFYKEKISDKIERYFAEDSYLSNHFSFTFFGYNRFNDAILNEEIADLEEYRRQTADGQLVRDSTLYLSYSPDKDIQYVAKASLPKGSEKSITIVLQFIHDEKEYSKVYTELLLNRQYKGLHLLDKYTYGVYQGGVRTNLSSNDAVDQSHLLSLVSPDKHIAEHESGDRSELILYDAHTQKTIIISKENGGAIKPFSLFSYIFSLQILVVLLLSLINTFYRFLPDRLNFRFLRNPPLGTKVQISVIALVVGGFVIIGVVTVFFFWNASEDYHEKKLRQKVESVIKNTYYQWDNYFTAPDSMQHFSELINQLSQIHQVDINLFTPDGQVILSSEPGPFDRGAISSRINIRAFLDLTKGGQEVIYSKEKIGNLQFKSAFIRLSDASGTSVGIMQLPYYSQSRELRTEVSDFLGALINAYIFLLLIASVIAITVSNSITRPIGMIVEKIRHFKLGNRSEHLVWDRDDELGELIKEYNRLVDKLEESAKLLAQKEREEAWREMAKQVAHDIKNPLTPMKLSIQYLLHAYKNNPAEIEPILRRVTQTLVEQIESLAHIASEFSNFAKMPTAHNEIFVLNDLVASVSNLFSQHQDIRFHLSLPEEPLQIYADRNHLIRVFNNLVKNAIQAIPNDQQGEISVSLTEELNNAIVRVKDNGIGIPDNLRDKVFQPNFTTRSSGSGLGLAISKNIVQSVNGKIYFETKQNEGTTFIVELPLAEVMAMVERPSGS
jgi:two-component system nitrogen regulation sensor histidine kinase NtrY